MENSSHRNNKPILPFLKSISIGSIIAFGICVSWCGSTQFLKSLYNHSAGFRAPFFVFVIYTGCYLLAALILFLLTNKYTHKCCDINAPLPNVTLGNASANNDSNADIVRNQNESRTAPDDGSRTNTKEEPKTSRNIHKNMVSDTSLAFPSNIKGFHNSLKHHIKSLYGLSLHPQTGKAQGKRKAFGRLILFSFLWSSSLYFYLLASISISPSELTTVFSSHVPFVYAFSWVLLHVRFLATKIIAIICFTTTIILITHYRGEFLNYLGQVMLVVLSSILYSLFKVNFRNIFGSVSPIPRIPHSGSIGSCPLQAAHQRFDHVTPTSNQNLCTQNKNLHRVASSPDYCNQFGGGGNFGSICTNNGGHALNQTAFFYIVLSFSNLLLFWPMVILFHFTRVEQVVWGQTKWTYLVFAAILHTAYTLFLEFASMFTNPNIINIGICLSVLANAVADIYLDRLNISVMVQVAYSFIIIGFILLMLPDEWYKYSRKIVRVKKVNGHSTCANTTDAGNTTGSNQINIQHGLGKSNASKNIGEIINDQGAKSLLTTIQGHQRHSLRPGFLGSKNESCLNLTLSGQEISNTNLVKDQKPANKKNLFEDLRDFRVADMIDMEPMDVSKKPKK